MQLHCYWSTKRSFRQQLRPESGPISAGNSVRADEHISDGSIARISSHVSLELQVAHEVAILGPGWRCKRWSRSMMKGECEGEREGGSS